MIQPGPAVEYQDREPIFHPKIVGEGIYKTQRAEPLILHWTPVLHRPDPSPTSKTHHQLVTR